MTIAAKALLAMVCLCPLSLASQSLSADEIMARVAANQDKAADIRTKYVYSQRVRIRALQNKGKLAREEDAVFIVTPQASKVDKKLVEMRASWIDKKKTRHQYSGNGKTPEVHGLRNIIDRALIEGLRDGLVDDKEAKDGIDSDLFPLTSKQVERYRFTLRAREQYRGRAASRIAFEPRPRDDDHKDRPIWEGEALIDDEDQQPVYVWTRFPKSLPMFVRVVFGTSIQQLGFSLTYEKVGDHVWFPASYGGEFRLRAAFFYARTMTLSLQNSDFRMVSAESRLVSAEEP